MALQVKCEECGADLRYKPGTRSLTCSYCEHTMAFDEPVSANEAHKELDLLSYIDNFDKNNQQLARQVINCKGCGAETELDENQQSDVCPFCDTPLVLQQAKTRKLIKPKGVLPFKIERSVARENFKKWLSGLWFAPNDLKKQITQHDKFKGIYLPFWTYDCDTTSYYTGQRGDHYYVTVQGTDSEGNATSRQEQRTRWSNARGQVRCAFDDILVPASKSLPQDELNALEPWDLKQLMDYKDEYLSGYIAETYQVSLKSGYDIAKKTMDSRIHREIKRDIGGDEQRIDSVDTRYQDASFKHILLPVWISA
ncbi:Primosomal protein N' (replication factor Y) -superfamily II helicase, partial [hydrothermal vent metagenome]